MLYSQRETVTSTRRPIFEAPLTDEWNGELGAPRDLQGEDNHEELDYVDIDAGPTNADEQRDCYSDKSSQSSDSASEESDSDPEGDDEN